jgi:hypothetical protein
MILQQLFTLSKIHNFFAMLKILRFGSILEYRMQIGIPFWLDESYFNAIMFMKECCDYLFNHSCVFFMLQHKNTC